MILLLLITIHTVVGTTSFIFHLCKSHQTLVVPLLPRAKYIFLRTKVLNLCTWKFFFKYQLFFPSLYALCANDPARRENTLSISSRPLEYYLDRVRPFFTIFTIYGHCLKLLYAWSCYSGRIRQHFLDSSGAWCQRENE